MNRQRTMWIRFIRDYGPYSNEQPKHRKGGVLPVDAVEADCFIEMEYAVPYRREEEFGIQERRVPAGGMG
jgi:hypothetical protein